ncbi:MAG: COQ9 family protein [Rhodospirillales bacterium]|nr:COQ9 family protein [Rhodospirillales bacterium]
MNESFDDPARDDPERDAALLAAMAHIDRRGWTLGAIRDGLAGLGADPALAALLFTRGGAELVAEWAAYADRQMLAAAAAENIAALRTPARIRRAIELRLAVLRPWRAPLRRGAALLAAQPLLAARVAAHTADALWQAAGDRSADFSWYTKRATLAAIHTATLLFWLRDASPDDAATLAFLDRRLADTARLGGLRRRLSRR